MIILFTVVFYFVTSQPIWSWIYLVLLFNIFLSCTVFDNCAIKRHIENIMTHNFPCIIFWLFVVRFLNLSTKNGLIRCIFLRGWFCSTSSIKYWWALSITGEACITDLCFVLKMLKHVHTGKTKRFSNTAGKKTHWVTVNVTAVGTMHGFSRSSDSDVTLHAVTSPQCIELLWAFIVNHSVRILEIYEVLLFFFTLR